MIPSPAALELLLPSGRAGRVVVLGCACPPGLAPAPRGATGPIDLAVVAPDAAEVREDGWLESALVRGAALSPDGMLVALLPPGARARAARLMRTAGLETGTPLLHYPRWRGDAGVVPLDAASLTEAMGSFVPLRGARRQLWHGLTRLPGAARLLLHLHPSVTLVGRQPGAAALAAWALAAGSGATRVAIRTKHRGGKGSIVLACLDGTARPFLKLATAGDELDHVRLERTAERLAALAPAARAAGARVPDAWIMTSAAGVTAMVETRLSGDTALARLERGASAPHQVVAPLADWLVRWHQATAVSAVLDQGRLEAEVLRPADAVAPALAGGTGYETWLQERCRALAGASVKLVASHGDLTMSNVLLSAGQAPGVVDWETSCREGLPLRDLWYAAADAEAAPTRYRDRPAAFDRSRQPSGPTGRLVAQASERIRHALELSPEFVTLCRHACWLQHAADEQTKRGPGEPRPFLAIVERIAAERAT